MMVRVRVISEPFDADAELAAFSRERRGAGALASFVGYCRGDAEGMAVRTLVLEHYPTFTESEIAKLAQAVARRRNVHELLVVHRSGVIRPTEPIVLVAALAQHRAEAFGAVEELMDYLKTDAPFWKREVTEEGTRWIEPTTEDRRRRGRWRDE